MTGAQLGGLLSDKVIYRDEQHGGTLQENPNEGLD